MTRSDRLVAGFALCAHTVHESFAAAMKVRILEEAYPWGLRAERARPLR